MEKRSGGVDVELVQIVDYLKPHAVDGVDSGRSFALTQAAVKKIREKFAKAKITAVADDEAEIEARRGLPQPGDPCANAVVSEVGQCWRMIHDRQRQAAHCTIRAIVSGKSGLSPEGRTSIYRVRPDLWRLSSAVKEQRGLANWFGELASLRSNISE